MNSFGPRHLDRLQTVTLNDDVPASVSMGAFKALKTFSRFCHSRSSEAMGMLGVAVLVQ